MRKYFKKFLRLEVLTPWPFDFQFSTLNTRLLRTPRYGIIVMCHDASLVFISDEIKLRAIQDFDPNHMRLGEKQQLQNILNVRRLEYISQYYKRFESQLETIKFGASMDIVYARDISVKFEQENQPWSSIYADDSYKTKEEVDIYTKAIPFQKGDKMETIPPVDYR